MRSIVRRRDQGNDPAKRATFLGAVVRGLPPEFEQDFLHDIVDIFIVFDHAADDRSDKSLMAMVERGERRFVAVLNAPHQLFVSDFIADCDETGDL